MQVDVPGRKSYVDPLLVVEIEYRQWTPYDRLRAPVFKGLALDVPTESVTWESEGPNRAPERRIVGRRIRGWAQPALRFLVASTLALSASSRSTTLVGSGASGATIS